MVLAIVWRGRVVVSSQMLHTVWPEKWHFLYDALTSSSNIDQLFFTVRIRRKFAIVLSLKIALHLKCVDTLRCEVSVSATIGILVGELLCWQFHAFSVVYLKPCARRPSAVHSWVVGDLPQLSELAMCFLVHHACVSSLGWSGLRDFSVDNFRATWPPKYVRCWFTDRDAVVAELYSGVCMFKFLLTWLDSFDPWHPPQRSEPHRSPSSQLLVMFC